MLFAGVGRFFFGPFWFPFTHFLCTLWNLFVLLFHILCFIDQKKKNETRLKVDKIIFP